MHGTMNVKFVNYSTYLAQYFCILFVFASSGFSEQGYNSYGALIATTLSHSITAGFRVNTLRTGDADLRF